MWARKTILCYQWTNKWIDNKGENNKNIQSKKGFWIWKEPGKDHYEAKLKERYGIIEKEREISLLTNEKLLIKTQNIVALEKDNEELKRYNAQISTDMIF